MHGIELRRNPCGGAAGLSEKVGAPHADLAKGVEKEHVYIGDSTIDFRSGNYGVLRLRCKWGRAVLVQCRVPLLCISKLVRRPHTSQSTRFPPRPYLEWSAVCECDSNEFLSAIQVNL